METYEPRLREAEARVRRRSCSGCRSTAWRCVCVDDANVRAILPRRDQAARHLRPRAKTPICARSTSSTSAAACDSSRRRRARRTSRSNWRCPACTTCATRWRPSRWAAKSACAECGDREGAGGVPRRRPPLPAPRRHRAGRRRDLHADRRLRPSPGRNGSHARRRARELSRSPAGARVSAASLHAHARPVRGFRPRAVDRRCAGAGRRLSGRRSADRRRRRTRARARVRVAGKVEPVFVEDVADLPATIRTLVQGRRRGADDGRGLHRRRAAVAAAPNDDARATSLHRPARNADPQRAAGEIHELARGRAADTLLCSGRSRRPGACSCASCPPTSR